MFSLRKALEKTMVLPDIYKPVCNSERLPIRHKYRSCKVRELPIVLKYCALWFSHNARKFCGMRETSFTEKSVLFRCFNTSVAMVIDYLSHGLKYEFNV